MKAQKLREKSMDELKELLNSSLKDHFDFRMQHATNQLSDTTKLGKVRGNIARIKTIINQKIKES